MMEHAGRNLAAIARADEPDSFVVLAGNGENGGGGLCAARHLTNRNLPVSVVLDRPPEGLDGAARTQYETLAAMGASVDFGETALDRSASTTVVDALVGYGLDGALRGTDADLVERVGDSDTPVVSLDVPSGVSATTGERAGTHQFIRTTNNRLEHSSSMRRGRTTCCCPRSGCIGVHRDPWS